MDERIEISVSKDKLQAYMIFLPPEDEGEEMPIERVFATIANNKITYGLNEEYIRNVYEHREYEREYKIAEGKEAVNGVDGEIELKIDFSNKNKPKIDVNGNVDYLNVDKYISVKANDVLAVYTPPTQGESGIDVYGKVVKAKNGKPARMPMGKNVVLNEDGVTITAKIDGLLELIDGRLYVEPVLYISGDVDLSTGNIDFVGNVQVRGSVRNGMVIKAQGSVEVDGMVESARIEAGGDIVLNGGIKGMGKAFLKANGKVTARYIESADVYSKGVVTVTSILQSIVETEDGVEVIGRGHIIGGSVRARNFIKCKSIGSSNNTTTNVMVGMPPELKRELSNLEKEVKKLKEEIAELDKVFNIPDEGLTPQQMSIKERLLKDKFEKSRALVTKNVKISELRDRMEMNTRSYISVEDVTYAGTSITINHATFNVRSDYKFTTFRELDGEVVATQHA